MPLPVLTPQQRAAAAARATEARRVRAEVKTELKTSRTTLAEVVERAQTDQALAKLRVQALVEAMPGIGKARAAQIMERVGIANSRRVRGLGRHQLAALQREFAR